MARGYEAQGEALLRSSRIQWARDGGLGDLAVEGKEPRSIAARGASMWMTRVPEGGLLLTVGAPTRWERDSRGGIHWSAAPKAWRGAQTMGHADSLSATPMADGRYFVKADASLAGKALWVAMEKGELKVGASDEAAFLSAAREMRANRLDFASALLASLATVGSAGLLAAAIAGKRQRKGPTKPLSSPPKPRGA